MPKVPSRSRGSRSRSVSPRVVSRPRSEWPFHQPLRPSLRRGAPHPGDRRSQPPAPGSAPAPSARPPPRSPRNRPSISSSVSETSIWATVPPARLWMTLASVSTKQRAVAFSASSRLGRFYTTIRTTVRKGFLARPPSLPRTPSSGRSVPCGRTPSSRRGCRLRASSRRSPLTKRRRRGARRGADPGRSAAEQVQEQRHATP